MGNLGLNHIHSRADFFRVLDEAITETSQKITVNPDWTILEVFMRQLLFMRATTSGGRKPLFEERQKITIGTILIREMESPPDLDWESYKTKLSNLGFYDRLWLTDRGLQELEKNGLPMDRSPNWDDMSDEPDTP
jgi:hypothetical protein